MTYSHPFSITQIKIVDKKKRKPKKPVSRPTKIERPEEIRVKTRFY